MEMIVSAALAIAIAHLVLGMILWLRVRKLYSFPGLLGFPVIGNLFYFYKTLLLCSLDSMEKHFVRIAEKYGKNGLCFHWVYGFRTLVIVSSPNLVKELAFHPNLSDKPDNMYGGILTYMEGLFASSRSDDTWKLKRKEYNIYLKRAHVDSEYFNAFIKCSDKLVEMMLASPSAVDAHHKSIVVALKAAMETLFGIETSLVSHPMIIKFMTQISDIASFFIGCPKITKIILTILRPLDAIFFGKPTELRKLAVDSMLASSQCPLPEQNLSTQIVSRIIKYNGSDKTLENEIQELFFTSTHTVAAILSNSIIFLALLPDIQERAWQEQYEIFGNDIRDPTIDDLEQMKFLDRFMKESLRFLGPGLVGKLATRDININEITIPQGANILYLLGYMRMDPKLWKNPKVFDPDRFLEECYSSKQAYSPFGIGIRNCPGLFKIINKKVRTYLKVCDESVVIVARSNTSPMKYRLKERIKGMYFATLLMKITLSKMLRRLKLRPVDKDFRFEDIQYKCYLMTEVANPPLLQVEERA